MIVGRGKTLSMWVIHGWYLRMLDDNSSRLIEMYEECETLRACMKDLCIAAVHLWVSAILI